MQAVYIAMIYVCGFVTLYTSIDAADSWWRNRTKP